MLTLLWNHLWQSTLFAGAAGLVTLTLRNNRAQVRHWLWVAASVKFLIPFAALIAIGRELGRRLLPAAPQGRLTIVWELVGQPFTRSVLPASPQTSTAVTTAAPDMAAIAASALVVLWVVVCAMLLVRWLVRWRQVLYAVRISTPIEDGCEHAILRRLEHETSVRRPLTLLLSDAPMEPGVFGIRKPVLLWPRRISTYLSDEQIEAIVAHELSHVRRHDNFLALLHMIVQAIFWFHPLVWWMGARLVNERERACDEDVIQQGSEPQVYAESILKTCEFSLESPLPCVAGVTGADLKNRIEAIMTPRDCRTLSIARRVLLAGAGISALLGPLVVGVFNAPRLEARGPAQSAMTPTFEVASVKPNNSVAGPMRIGIQPGGRFTATDVPLRSLIRNAYMLQEVQIVGGPDWVGSNRFDIVARAEGNVPPEPPGTVGALQLMMQSLLADRFKLVAHHEKRVMPIYSLVMAKGDGRLGSQLHVSADDCTAIMKAAMARGGPPPPPPGDRPLCGLRMQFGRIIAGGFPLSLLAMNLSPLVQRIVVDRTGLAGNYDFELTFTPEQMRPQPPPGAPEPRPIDPNGPSLFTALQEQLGLKLESTRGQVDVLVIDHVELPTPD